MGTCIFLWNSSKSDTRAAISTVQIARHGERGARDHVVPGAGLRGLDLDRLDPALGQLGGHRELLRRVVLAAVAAVEEVDVHLVRPELGLDGLAEAERDLIRGA